MISPGGCSPNIKYPRTVAIIQARLGSERFPGKVFKDLYGHPLLWWVVERLKKSQYINQIVIATPDKEIYSYAYSLGVWGFLDEGDPNNVLARYMKAANWSNAEIVVRITGDEPLIDPEIVDNTIKGYIENRVDISTNVLRRTYPKGLDVEVLHKNVIKRIFHLTEDPRYREHVTLFAYEHQSLFVFNSIFQKDDYSRFNVSVDTPKDLDRLQSLMVTLNTDISVGDIVKYFLEKGE